jgi:hypothetical protein
MIQQALVTGYSNPLRVVDAADFDGANDYMSRGGELTGMSDGKQGIISVWVRLDGGNASNLYIADNAPAAGSSSFYLIRSAGNKFTIQGRSSPGGTLILSLQTANTYTSSTTWLHVLASWDMAVGTSGSLYISDTSDSTSPIFTDSTLDYTQGAFTIGGDGSGPSPSFNGAIAELYFAPGQYLDFSNVYNRRKFISATGKPVHLGTDGSLPTGTAPLLYCHLDDGEAVANFATNRGTGGDLSITGALATASDSPSD